MVETLISLSTKWVLQFDSHALPLFEQDWGESRYSDTWWISPFMKDCFEMIFMMPVKKKFFLIQIFVVADTISGTQYLPGEQVWAFSLLFFSILWVKIFASCIISILDSSFHCSNSLCLCCVHILIWALPVPLEFFLVLPRSLDCLLFGKPFLPVLAVLLWVLTWCDPPVLHSEW